MRCLKALALLLWCPAFLAFCSDLTDLKDKLEGFNAFYAKFTQTLSTKKQESSVSSRGYIAVKKPQKLMMFTQEPDEQVLFTRGDAVYLYDPFVNQVSIFSLADLKASPFFLLTSTENRLWDNYEVRRSGEESFTLKPKKSQQIAELRLTFAGATLERISILMSDGQLNTYTLSEQRTQVDDSLFNYEIPSDAEIDDGRRQD